MAGFQNQPERACPGRSHDRISKPLTHRIRSSVASPLLRPGTGALRNSGLLLLTALLPLLAPPSSLAHSPGDPLAFAKIFRAAPGSNTLQVARDAVRAWRTEGHAKEAAAILLLPGEYALTEPLTLDGRDGAVTWRARDAEKTLITGGQRITGFSADPAGIWHAQTGRPLEQLYVNGRRATRARWPLEGFFKMDGRATGGICPVTRRASRSNCPRPQLASLPPDPAALLDAQILVYHNWDTSRYAVASVNAAAGTVTVEGERMKPWNPWNAQ